MDTNSQGPTGTGKMFTVGELTLPQLWRVLLIRIEYVAEYTRRPLLLLTVADIGTEESDTEAHPSKWFYLQLDGELCFSSMKLMYFWNAAEQLISRATTWCQERCEHFWRSPTA